MSVENSSKIVLPGKVNKNLVVFKYGSMLEERTHYFVSIDADSLRLDADAIAGKKGKITVIPSVDPERKISFNGEVATSRGRVLRLKVKIPDEYGGWGEAFLGTPVTVIVEEDAEQ